MPVSGSDIAWIVTMQKICIIKFRIENWIQQLFTPNRISALPLIKSDQNRNPFAWKVTITFQMYVIVFRIFVKNKLCVANWTVGNKNELEEMWTQIRIASASHWIFAIAFAPCGAFPSQYAQEMDHSKRPVYITPIEHKKVRCVQRMRWRRAQCVNK